MLSIITPVYNGEKYIEACIKSLLYQSCEDFEHIIIDGKSTDKTVKIIQDYASFHSHIRWISEKDNGQSDAMNKGISMAKGDVLSMLNVDDYYEPNVLNYVIRIFKDLQVSSLLVGNCNIWNAQGELTKVNKPQKLELSELLLGYNANPYPVNPSAYFYHKTLHEKIGLYDVDQYYTMDIDFLFRAVSEAHLVYVDKTLGNFRQLEDTKTIKGFQNNEVGQNVDRLMKAYRRQLPLIKRLWVAVGYEFYRHVYPRLKYYAKDPLKFPKSIKSKLTRPT